jgi:hypothetical protein
VVGLIDMGSGRSNENDQASLGALIGVVGALLFHEPAPEKLTTEAEALLPIPTIAKQAHAKRPSNFVATTRPPLNQSPREYL